jgi:prepilin-type N-terminal cleavage/methylation domain-containing protein
MRRRSRGSRGWTLPELLAAVVIVAILAVIAIPAYRSLIVSSYKAEPARVLGAIRTAQEGYKGVHLRYAQPSAALGVPGTTTNCYPTDTPGRKTVGWGALCPTCGGTVEWRELDVKVDGPVMYGYSAVAGLPGVAPPAVTLRLRAGPTSMTWAARPGYDTAAWYVMSAVGDVAGDGNACMVLGTSLAPRELFFEAQCQ